MSESVFVSIVTWFVNITGDILMGMNSIVFIRFTDGGELTLLSIFYGTIITGFIVRFVGGIFGKSSDEVTTGGTDKEKPKGRVIK